MLTPWASGLPADEKVCPSGAVATGAGTHEVGGGRSSPTLSGAGGIVDLDRTKRRARVLRKAMTKAEAALWNLLRRRPTGFDIRTQLGHVSRTRSRAPG